MASNAAFKKSETANCLMTCNNFRPFYGYVIEEDKDKAFSFQLKQNAGFHLSQITKLWQNLILQSTPE